GGAVLRELAGGLLPPLAAGARREGVEELLGAALELVGRLRRRLLGAGGGVLRALRRRAGGRRGGRVGGIGRRAGRVGGLGGRAGRVGLVRRRRVLALRLLRGVLRGQAITSPGSGGG